MTIAVLSGISVSDEEKIFGNAVIAITDITLQKVVSP